MIDYSDYFIVPIKQSFPIKNWQPDIALGVDCEVRCYNIAELTCKIKVTNKGPLTNGTPITKEQYEEGC